MVGKEKTIRRSLPVLSSPAAPAAAAAGAGSVESMGGDPRIAVVTLGCDKNTVDSERVLGRLAGAGFAASAETDGADVLVINTCGFIDVAKEESIDAILEAVRLKGEGRARAVVAMGCLVQRYKSELEAELPEVDLFLGLTEVDRLLPELEARGVIPAREALVPTMERPLRVLSTSTPHTSFLKISEGCDHGCAFCAIPLMRGKHRSTPIERLVREARELEAGGVVELNIISQDTTWYGRDWRGGAAGEGAEELFVGRAFAGMAGGGAVETAREALSARVAPGPAGPVRVNGGAGAGPGAALASAGGGSLAGAVAAAGAVERRRGALPELLQELLAGTGVPWFRLFYMYPSGISRELVELIAGEPRILPYLDMPIQHGVDSVLKRMRRPERQSTIRERVGWLRDAVPDLVLRTTVIVGFPGETEEEFEMLLDLLEEIRFDHLGAFSYSREEGTPAAALAEQVDGGLRRERLERVLDLQRSIALEKNEALIGREVEVLIDRVEEGGGVVGRTAGQALDVDGVTRIVGRTGSAMAAEGAENGAPHARPGEFVRVRITGAYEDELAGELV
jgi:tRNA A37 methylthiotransferase MiaB